MVPPLPKYKLILVSNLQKDVVYSTQILVSTQMNLQLTHFEFLTTYAQLEVVLTAAQQGARKVGIPEPEIACWADEIP